jgi:hypothetical protein
LHLPAVVGLFDQFRVDLLNRSRAVNRVAAPVGDAKLNDISGQPRYRRVLGVKIPAVAASYSLVAADDSVGERNDGVGAVNAAAGASSINPRWLCFAKQHCRYLTLNRRRQYLRHCG